MRHALVGERATDRAAARHPGSSQPERLRAAQAPAGRLAPRLSNQARLSGLAGQVQRIPPRPSQRPLPWRGPAGGVAGGVQAKLAVSQPGDVYEQEADRVAEQVLRTAELALQRKCACEDSSAGGGECAECARRKALTTPAPARPAVRVQRSPEIEGGDEDLVVIDEDASDGDTEVAGLADEPEGGSSDVESESVGGLLELAGAFLGGEAQAAEGGGQQKKPKKPPLIPVRTRRRWITRIDVDLTEQTLSFTWTDGTQLDQPRTISSGKGRPCTKTDPCANQTEKNCTPVGTFTASGFGNANTVNSNGDAMAWFVGIGVRGIGIHNSQRADGKPRSHGCIRVGKGKAAMAFALLINSNARRGQTKIVITGKAPTKPWKPPQGCPKKKEKEPQETGKKVQRVASDQSPGLEAPPSVEQVLSAPGEPLPSGVRRFMEAGFGHDFSHVRVHADARAQQSAADVSARAYTVGADIVFGRGEYEPNSSAGRRLLAHELTHVLQQGAVAGVAGVGGGRLQRAMGDGHDLESPRFKGDPVLEACFDDEARLTMNGLGKPGTTKVESGPPVLAVQKALVELGYLEAGQANGRYTEATWNAVKKLKKDKGLGWETMGDVGPGTMAWLDKQFPPATCAPCPDPGPRPPSCPPCPATTCPPCPSESPRPPECPPCPAASSHVCGPDIDARLTKVMTDMQTHFRGLTGWQKHWSCQWLITPPMAIMAWDIHQLYLHETGWLRRPPFSPPCGLPVAPAGGDVEDPATCSNSVRVGGKCNLAGTANYATFGVMMRECHSFYIGSPPLPTQKLSAMFFTLGAMKLLIGLYKTVKLDDRGPPTEFAVATYTGGPSSRPTTENRKHCSTACASPAAPPAFTFVWEPYQAR